VKAVPSNDGGGGGTISALTQQTTMLVSVWKDVAMLFYMAQDSFTG
jgi:hypothetical protein